MIYYYHTHNMLDFITKLNWFFKLSLKEYYFYFIKEEYYF